MKQDWTDKLRNMMADYSEQPSDRVWKSVHEMSVARKPASWHWKSCIAAAVLLLGTVVSLKFLKPVHSPEVLTAEDLSGTVTDIVPSFIDSHAIDTQKNTYSRSSVLRKSIDSRKSSAPVAVNEGEGTDSPIGSLAGPEQLNGAPVPSAGNEASEEKDDYDDQSDLWAELIDEERPYNKKRKGRISTSVSATGSANGSSVINRPTGSVMGANPLVPGVTSVDWVDGEFSKRAPYLVYNQPELKTEYSHRIPVKIGVSVRYDFTRRLGLETGLTYSLLSSELTTGEENSSGSWSKGQQTLHYIGIPVNLVCNLLQTRYVDLYISAGGMMEKGLRGNLKTDDYQNGKFAESHSTRLTPKGLQWSANAVGGLQVNILPSFGIFVEPGISHRFKSNSGVRSIYSDKPTDFSLGFGLRYHFD